MHIRYGTVALLTVLMLVALAPPALGANARTVPRCYVQRYNSGPCCYIYWRSADFGEMTCYATRPE